ncbi:hypothetical protein PR048_021146 [Dryococelus australis]|uniref:Uncharacterized protein n=1 Tax=Dryococelus australis TaxID=614101 RepID=A0ABQ9GXD4_9NEOP|nr:hypothetical protein PR048_021146 [Dryococelus australis]
MEDHDDSCDNLVVSDVATLSLSGPSAPPHFHREILKFVNSGLPNRCIGCSGNGDYQLLSWPTRSPDLTPCDFFVWGYVKEAVNSRDCGGLASKSLTRLFGFDIRFSSGSRPGYRKWGTWRAKLLVEEVRRRGEKERGVSFLRTLPFHPQLHSIITFYVTLQELQAARGWIETHPGPNQDDGAGQRVFTGISRFPRPSISALLYSHLPSPSSALETSAADDGRLHRHTTNHLRNSGRIAAANTCLKARELIETMVGKLVIKAWEPRSAIRNAEKFSACKKYGRVSVVRVSFGSPRRTMPRGTQRRSASLRLGTKIAPAVINESGRRLRVEISLANNSPPARTSIRNWRLLVSRYHVACLVIEILARLLATFRPPRVGNKVAARAQRCPLITDTWVQSRVRPALIEMMYHFNVCLATSFDTGDVLYFQQFSPALIEMMYHFNVLLTFSNGYVNSAHESGGVLMFRTRTLTPHDLWRPTGSISTLWLSCRRRRARPPRQWQCWASKRGPRPGDLPCWRLGVPSGARWPRAAIAPTLYTTPPSLTTFLGGGPQTQSTPLLIDLQTEKQFNVGTRSLVVRSQRDRCTSTLVYGPYQDARTASSWYIYSNELVLNGSYQQRSMQTALPARRGRNTASSALSPTSTHSRLTSRPSSAVLRLAKS